MNSDPTPAAHLPAPLPSPAALLHRTQAALGLLRDVVQESSAEYWYELGKEASKEGNLADANYAFRRCIQIDSNYWRGRLQLALILAQQSQVQESAKALLDFYTTAYINYIPFKEELSISDWEIINKLFEDYNLYSTPNFDVSLALIVGRWVIQYYFKISSKTYPSVRELIESTHKKFPERVMSSSIWNQLSGDLWYKLGEQRNNKLDYLYSLARFNTTITLNKGNASIYVDRGNVSYKLQDINGAFADYETAIQLSPKFVEAYTNRGQRKYWIKDFKGAVTDFDQAISIAPHIAYNFWLRAAAKLRDEDYQSCISDCDKAIGLGHSYSISTTHNSLQTRASAKEKLGDIAGAHRDRFDATNLARQWEGANDEY